MRTILLAVFLVTACAAPYSVLIGAAGGADERPAKAQDEAGKRPPLKLEDRKPLLLLDDAPLSAPTGQEADNSRCHVCHLNFVDEEIATVHARQKIGCQHCHGECDKHMDDESWASGGTGTAPDIMFPVEKIDASCGKCHETHDAPAKAVLQRWQDRCPDLKDMSRVVCTNCHGQHQVVPKLRKAWWDKTTGKPLAPKPEPSGDAAAKSR